MGLHVPPPASTLLSQLAHPSNAPAKNVFVIFEGNGGNSAYHAGVVRYLSTLDINPVGFVGTSGGAKTATAAAVGLMRGGMDGMSENTDKYWSVVGKEGDTCVMGMNPIMNLFAAANILTNSHPATLARTLSRIDRSVISETNIDDLKKSGIYLGMNAVSSATDEDIYIGIDHVSHKTLMATAALAPAFPEVTLPEMRDTHTGQLIFEGGRTRDGGQGGENPIGIRALIDFEKHNPHMVGNYDVLVVSLGTSSDDAADGKILPERKVNTLQSIKELRGMVGKRLHVLHADMSDYFAMRPLESSPLYASTRKVTALSQLGFEQARENLSRSLGAVSVPFYGPPAPSARH